MQDYIYYIFKDGEFKKYTYDELLEIINKDSYLIRTINSYMAPVYLYKKTNETKWKVLLKFDDFIDFIIKHEKNNIILYTFQPKNIEHITKAIIQQKESIKHQEKQKTIEEYIPKEIYKTNDLFVATISCNKELAIFLNLPNDILNQKFILELEGNMYREIFSGILVSNEPTNNYQFSVINIEPLSIYTDKQENSKLELFLLQNKINSKKSRKRYIKRKSHLT